MTHYGRFRSLPIAVALAGIAVLLIGSCACAAQPVPGDLTAVPEPGSLLALATGLIGLIGFVKKRR